MVTDVQRLSLEVMTLNPMCEMVETAQGVPLTVTGVAQCKIMKVCKFVQCVCSMRMPKKLSKYTYYIIANRILDFIRIFNSKEIKYFEMHLEQNM